MIYTDLYNEVLIKPCQEGADELKIISGYATATMATEHLEDLYKQNLKNIHIKLLIGMCPSDGLSMSNHQGFQNLVKSDSKKLKNRFECSYIYKAPSVHSKLYIWYKNKNIYKAFIGSANYTKNAFYYQRESLSEIKDDSILQYYELIEKDSIYCNHQEIEEWIRIYNDGNYYRKQIYKEEANTENQEFEHITISFLGRVGKWKGKVQGTAGLNWAHGENRKKLNRNLNEAYIQLPPEIWHSTFFPEKPQHFTVVTDDSKSFICCRAQKTGTPGTAIETPHSNALLGEYFRNRLGLAYGAKVTRQDLEKYGRTDVTFYKIDDENYYMDFSV